MTCARVELRWVLVMPPNYLQMPDALLPCNVDYGLEQRRATRTRSCINQLSD